MVVFSIERQLEHRLKVSRALGMAGVMVQCPRGKTKVEQESHYMYYTTLPETKLQIGLLDYRASGPLASSDFKHVFQALFEGICVLSQQLTAALLFVKVHFKSQLLCEANHVLMLAYKE